LHQSPNNLREMLMDDQPVPRASTRLGFHYFNDSLHYRESDLQTWLPEIKACGASWLTLIAPQDRAIPEGFIRSLIQENIEPVLHFKLPLPNPPDKESLGLLFNVYSQWGIRYVVLYDRPNRRQSWSGNSWAQNDLVERFLDNFLPVADLALQYSLTPVFPPLEPGGDYWDTAFLRAALSAIKRRGQEQLAENLVLGAYAWVNRHPLGWGAGGPERWPQARPYHTPTGQENQLGFYISDWYLAIAEAELGRPRPLILLAAGFPPHSMNGSEKNDLDLTYHTEAHATIAGLMSGRLVENPTNLELLTPPSAQVMACNFWLLAADSGSPDAALAWFHPNGNGSVEINLPIVTAMRQLQQFPAGRILSQKKADLSVSNRPINHYLLLSEGCLENRDQFPGELWHFINETHPTIGFSVEEAALAARVTVFGSQEPFPTNTLESLRIAGARVEHLGGDGTSIAPQHSTHDIDLLRGEP
jgi:hypothetical protein